MPNRLAYETSPYLQQHKDNPVDWYPWDETALKIAQQENKPIFLSIGYSACHWCHVMAHESFENPATAQLLNENFINIKVDREERPDLDDIYMQAVVLLIGQGGWPLSVFLTPSLQPFFGGTYFPPIPRYGMPSFNQVLNAVIESWKNQPQSVQKNADILTSAIKAKQAHQVDSSTTLDLDAIAAKLYAAYDWHSGGWGQAPRFPQPMLIDFLIQRALAGNARSSELVNHLLDHMALGGMYDLVGGGFHRYSTDAHWLIPHFEKMLYDNAQLARTYLHAFSLTGKLRYKEVTQEILAFLQREMTSAEGGFFASMDADTPEGEGRYYAWTINQLKDVLSQEEFQHLQEMTEIKPDGNFDTGLNLIRLRNTDRTDFPDLKILRAILSKLKAVRDLRSPPGKDQKIITEWNAMAIQAFAEAGLLLNRPDYLQIAQDTVKFILGNLTSSEGKLYRSWRAGKANQPGTLADYANLIAALQAVYVIDFDPQIFERMRSLFVTLKEDFSSEDVLYYDASAHVSDLIIRPRNIQDNATPSGNAMAAYIHWLFANYNHDPNHFDRAAHMISQAGNDLEDYPTSFGYWLQVADLLKMAAQQIALVSPGDLNTLKPFLDIFRRKFRPFSVIAAQYTGMHTQGDLPEILANRPSIDGKSTAYVCQGFICQRPVTKSSDFESQIR